MDVLLIAVRITQASAWWENASLKIDIQFLRFFFSVEIPQRVKKDTHYVLTLDCIHIY